MKEPTLEYKTVDTARRPDVHIDNSDVIEELPGPPQHLELPASTDTQETRKITPEFPTFITKIPTIPNGHSDDTEELAADRLRALVKKRQEMREASVATQSLADEPADVMKTPYYNSPINIQTDGVDPHAEKMQQDMHAERNNTRAPQPTPTYNQPIPLESDAAAQNHAATMLEQMTQGNTPQQRPPEIPLVSDFESQLSATARTKANEIYNRLLQTSWNFTDERVNQTINEALGESISIPPNADPGTRTRLQTEQNEQYQVRMAVRNRMEQLRPVTRAAYDLDAQIHKHLADGSLRGDAIAEYVNKAVERYIQENNLHITPEQRALLENRLMNGMEGYQAAETVRQNQAQVVASPNPEVPTPPPDKDPIDPKILQNKKIVDDLTALVTNQAGNSTETESDKKDLIHKAVENYIIVHGLGNTITPDQKVAIYNELNNRAAATPAKIQNPPIQKRTLMQRIGRFFGL